MSDRNLLDLERKINYTFNTRSLLREALTHRSFSKNHNEKLEFLGDSILNFSISSFIFVEEKALDEGQLSRIRSNLVNQNSLIKIARFIALDKYLYVGATLTVKNGYIRDSIVADSLEAIFGAVFLDGGVSRAKEVIV
ncbi:MAG: ribonuclease III domain-containing protein, partial [Burkholderiaceae bacterium]